MERWAGTFNYLRGCDMSHPDNVDFTHGDYCEGGLNGLSVEDTCGTNDAIDNCRIPTFPYGFRETYCDSTTGGCADVYRMHDCTCPSLISPPPPSPPPSVPPPTPPLAPGEAIVGVILTEQFTTTIQVVLDQTAADNRAQQYANAIAQVFTTKIASKTTVVVTLGDTTYTGVSVDTPPAAPPPLQLDFVPGRAMRRRLKAETDECGTQYTTLRAEVTLESAARIEDINAMIDALPAQTFNAQGNVVVMCDQHSVPIVGLWPFPGPPPPRPPPSPLRPPPTPRRPVEALEAAPTWLPWTILGGLFGFLFLCVLCCFFFFFYGNDEEFDEEQRKKRYSEYEPGKTETAMGSVMLSKFAGRFRTAEERPFTSVKAQRLTTKGGM